VFEEECFCIHARCGDDPNETGEGIPLRALRHRPALRSNGLAIESSLYLSRACLGKMIVHIYKWCKKTVFTHQGGGAMDNRNLQENGTLL
jgi:hypothetical protein